MGKNRSKQNREVQITDIEIQLKLVTRDSCKRFAKFNNMLICAVRHSSTKKQTKLATANYIEIYTVVMTTARTDDRLDHTAPGDMRSTKSPRLFEAASPNFSVDLRISKQVF